MRYALTLIAAIALAGCSSVPTKVDHGPIKARTFSFFDGGGRPLPPFAENQPDVHAKIQESITRNLAAKGVSKLDKGGDVTVGYLVVVSTGGVTSAINGYFGYDEAGAELQDKAHKAFAIDNDTPSAYPEGALVIDVMDPKTNQLLRRHTVVRPIMKDLPMEQRLTRLQEAVDEDLKGLRIVQ